MFCFPVTLRHPLAVLFRILSSLLPAPLGGSISNLCSLVLLVVTLSVLAQELPAEEPAPQAPTPVLQENPPAPPLAVSEDLANLTARLRKSVVVIRVKGRTEDRHAIGSGFIVDPTGLVVTNLHVIGESRPIEVLLEDGRKLEVTHVHASDRHLDLALLKVTGENLPSLTLGDSDQLRQGEEVFALGNPLGLELSVVSGLVSALREVEGRPMIQVAMPIEQGNSGGPLFDRKGNVQGIITLKSLRLPNLGFAAKVNQLKPLLEKPNPISMSRWLTMEQMDPQEWIPLLGARWRQRGGRIEVEGAGNGFGGRSLCLSSQQIDQSPFDLAVEVKLSSEEGAAGLVFHSDAEQRHYGFYPSGGKLRLSRFDGPDVFEWKVLEEISTPHYRPGEWNHLRVHLHAAGIDCYVNHELVLRSQDRVYTTGQVGLAKFRETQAQFRRFQVGKTFSPPVQDESLQKELSTLLNSPEEPRLDQFLKNATFQQQSAIDQIREHARTLENQAASLRRISLRLHEESVRRSLSQMLEGPPDKISLTRASLLISQLDNEETDVDHTIRSLARMAEEVKAALPLDSTQDQKRKTLHQFLYQEWGFHGSRHDYYVKENSYVDRVVEDREGLPITLAVVYLDLSQRIGMTTKGIPLPGHFMVAHFIPDQAPVYIDVFEQGAELSPQEMKLRILAISGMPPTEAATTPATDRQILERMTRNLLALAQEAEDLEGMNRYVESLIVIDPSSLDHHLKRALLRFQRRDYQGALADIDWLEKSDSAQIDRDRISQLRSLIERGLRQEGE